MARKKDDSERGLPDELTSPEQSPAVPPLDDPLRRAAEFDLEEYDSREMAEKRLEALRKTREMPKADEEPSQSKPETNVEKDNSDSS